MENSHATTMECETPRPPSTFLPGSLACFLLTLAALPWLVVMILMFYLMAPPWLHYLVYDNLVAACILCLILCAPALLALILAIIVTTNIRRHQVDRSSIILEVACAVFAVCCIACVFWGTVISRANPHAAGYWL